MGSISTAEPWSFQRADSLMSLLQAALSARSQADWSRWLQVDIQEFLPHDILIAAWGDFKSGVVGYDVITQSPALLEHALPKDIIEPLMETVFDHWLAGGQEPLAIDTRMLRSVGSGLFAKSPYALVHGVQDHRSRYDCIYVFIGSTELSTPSCAQLCRMALPFIDTGFRQLADRGRQLAHAEMPETGFASCYSDVPFVRRPPHEQDALPEAVEAEADDSWDDYVPGERGPLSGRELEVMQWVRMGKTNSEIAMILNLSTFTVKNHMRRIYKKLDVLNRAQAVGSLDSMQRPGQARGAERTAGPARQEHAQVRSMERPKMAPFTRAVEARRTPHPQ